MMREAIHRCVKLDDSTRRLRDEALAAWAEYQATGLHATNAEVDDWLAKPEAGEDVPPPECHT